MKLEMCSATSTENAVIAASSQHFVHSFVQCKPFIEY